ncbi:Chitin synthase, class 1, partial [Xenoophorus captivus]
VLPAVWFQMFEYVISHWLQKTAEHVFGCVLCSPGCFSLFRAEALMDDNVMKKYSTTSTEPSHYIQYDQGNGQGPLAVHFAGWRVEYNAASDAYTNAPEDFKELYNQELPLVFYGFLYIACIPSAYLLLTIYSMVNMNSVS